VRRRPIIAVLLLLLLVPVIGVPLAPAVGRALGHRLVRDDVLDADALPADALVVLGGDVYKRAPYAATLFAQGVAPRIVAVGGTADQGELSEARKTTKVLLAHDVPQDAIVALGIDEPSTSDEARAVAELVRLRQWHHLVVVTSPYHTWRAGKIFRRALPDDVELSVKPSPLDPFDPDAWWQDARSRRLLRNEYGKLVLWWVER